MIWDSADEWKEELALPDYHEVRVGGKQLIWVSRSQPHLTEAALHASPIASMTGEAMRESPFRVSRVQNTVKGKVALRCFSLKPIKTKECFDADQGFFLNSSDNATSGRIRIEFSDYFRLGEHFVPRRKQEFRDDHPVVEVIIRDASLNHQVDSATFAPAPGATRIGGCLSPALPKPIAEPTPGARRAKVTGTVALEVMIDSHGSIENAAVVESLDPDLDGKAVETIKKKWRFEPATCSGVPVPFEFVVEVDFLHSLF